ncbi:unnamed protein product, partial [Effrenium voratum]
ENGKKKEDKKAIKAAAKVAAKGPQINLEPPSGTRDFFPADMRLQNFLFSASAEDLFQTTRTGRIVSTPDQGGASKGLFSNGS